MLQRIANIQPWRAACVSWPVRCDSKGRDPFMHRRREVRYRGISVQLVIAVKKPFLPLMPGWKPGPRETLTNTAVPLP